MNNMKKIDAALLTIFAVVLMLGTVGTAINGFKGDNLFSNIMQGLVAFGGLLCWRSAIKYFYRSVLDVVTNEDKPTQ